jgi:hypothetical protein
MCRNQPRFEENPLPRLQAHQNTRNYQNMMQTGLFQDHSKRNNWQNFEGSKETVELLPTGPVFEIFVDIPSRDAQQSKGVMNPSRMSIFHYAWDCSRSKQMLLLRW